MTDEVLHQRLVHVKGLVERLADEAQAEHIDHGILGELDAVLEQGLRTDPRTVDLAVLLDDLMENTEATRAEMFSEAVHDCETIKAHIDGLMTGLDHAS